MTKLPAGPTLRAMTDASAPGTRHASGTNEGAPRPALSLVICTYNEALAIGAVLREAQQALAGLDVEIIVVDDSTDDQTASVVRAHAAADPRITLLRRQGARGLASAAIAGWAAARGSALAIMDGDGQHEVRLLPAMLAALTAETDLVVASRYVAGRRDRTGLNARRHAMSRAATLATRLCLGCSVSDPMSGFFVFRRAWFEAARPHLSGVGFKILVDLMMSGPRAPRVVEIGAALRPRLDGASKLDLRVILELAALLIEKRTGGVVPASFTLFACVGGTGIGVSMAALGSAEALHVAPFWLAQGLAIFVAMGWNFHLNNVLTFRERRLQGRALLAGFAAFVVSCTGGAILSEIVGTGAHQLGANWACASLAGTVSAAFWNYWSTARSAWAGLPRQPSGVARAEPASPQARSGLTAPSAGE